MHEKDDELDQEMTMSSSRMTSKREHRGKVEASMAVRLEARREARHSTVEVVRAVRSRRGECHTHPHEPW